MSGERDFDSRIKAALENECAGIVASEKLKDRIDAEVCEQRAERERRNLGKRISGKKICVAAAAACLLMAGISVFAGNVDFFVSVGGMEPDYTDYRDMEKVQDKLGYGVDSVERFANGYEFAGASVDFLSAYSEENGEMYSVPTADVRYRKDGKLIDLTVSEAAQAAVSDTRPKEPKAVRACGDITLRYDEVTDKMVPEGYELTEEDRINEQRDDFHITYLSVTEKEGVVTGEKTESDNEQQNHYCVAANDTAASVMLRQTGENWMDWKEGGEPYISQMQMVSWEKGGKRYELSGVDLDMDAEELFDMAQELIGAETE